MSVNFSSSNTIIAYQGNWAFTTSDSPKTTVRTSSFGSCYVLSLTASSGTTNFAALAHIGYCTQINSIQEIFERFQKHNIHLKDVTAILIGGWKYHPSSVVWGDMISKKLQEMKIGKINEKLKYSRRTPTSDEFDHPLPNTQKETYYYGAAVDAKTNTTILIPELCMELELEQERRMASLVPILKTNSLFERPIQEVTASQ